MQREREWSNTLISMCTFKFDAAWQRINQSNTDVIIIKLRVNDQSSRSHILNKSA